LRNDGERLSSVTLKRSNSEGARRRGHQTANRNDARVRAQFVDELLILTRLCNLSQGLL
jgi:hypothetical protein